MFQNAGASRLAVLAMPHNITQTDDAALTAAMKDLLPYRCSRITGTKLHYLPISGSNTSVFADGQMLASAMTRRMRSFARGTR